MAINGLSSSELTELYTAAAEGNQNAINFLTNEYENLKNVNTSNYDNVTAKINEIKTKIEQYKKQLEESEEKIAFYEKQLAIQQKQLIEAKENYNTESKELKDDINLYDSTVEKYNEIEQRIENATSSLEADTKKRQQDAIYTAMANYNEEEDGDWGSYLQKEINGAGVDNSLVGLLEYLSTQDKNICRALGKYKTDVKRQTSVVSESEKNYSDISNTLASTEKMLKNEKQVKTNLEASIQSAQTEMATTILSNVSDAEKQLAIDNNLDLSEKLQDGSPRYIIAPGKSDNKLHIYDLSQGASLARLYGEGGGYDIVASGNGYIQMNDNAQGGNTDVYYFDSIDECLKSGEAGTCKKCYCTSSPLSFDINGDGVKTSSKMIKYDIDGDGKLDNINDSTDGILVFDSDGDGISGENGKEAFGDNTDLDGDGIKDGYKDGFEALKALAKKEGLIGDNDTKLDEKDLKILEEKYGLKMKTQGYNSQAKSLSEVGITEINLAKTDKTTLHKNYDGQNNDLMTQEGTTFKINGEEREYADIWHAKKEAQNEAKASKVVSEKVSQSEVDRAKNLVFLNLTTKNSLEIDFNENLFDKSVVDKKYFDANDFIKPENNDVNKEEQLEQQKLEEERLKEEELEKEKLEEEELEKESKKKK